MRSTECPLVFDFAPSYIDCLLYGVSLFSDGRKSSAALLLLLPLLFSRAMREMELTSGLHSARFCGAVRASEGLLASVDDGERGGVISPRAPG